MDDNIYFTRCDIYGIKIYIFTNDKYTILFERKFKTIMSYETIIETKLFYEKLDENDKKIIKFKIYTKCENKYDTSICMIWLNILPDYFIKKFGI
jgi:hypothetical protein